MKQHEIDEAYYFKSKGYKASFLDEPSTPGGHPDLLLNESVIVELKQITGNAKTAAKKIRDAINKQGVDVPAVFFIGGAVNLSDNEITAELKKDTHIKRDISDIVIVRNYDKVSIINKKAPSSTSDVSKYGTEAKLGAITDNTTLPKNVNTPLPLFQTEKEMLSYAAEFGSWEDWV